MLKFTKFQIHLTNCWASFLEFTSSTNSLTLRRQSFLDLLGIHSAIRSQRSGVDIGYVFMACSNKACSSFVHAFNAVFDDFVLPAVEAGIFPLVWFSLDSLLPAISEDISLLTVMSEDVTTSFLDFSKFSKAVALACVLSVFFEKSLCCNALALLRTSRAVILASPVECWFINEAITSQRCDVPAWL